MTRTGLPAVRKVQSVERASTLLAALADARADLGTNELARRTGINVSSVSRLLSTLNASGLVQHIPSTGRYRLGLRLLHLANAARDGMDVRGLAHPHLEELTSNTGETSTLCVDDGGQILVLDFAMSPQSVRSVAEVGRASSPHATSVGKVFLAYASHPPVTDLARYTSATITSRRDLNKTTDEIRTQGYAVALGEREESLHGVAVPVLDRNDRLRATLGVQGPASRLPLERLRTFVPELKERANLIAAAFED